MTTLLVRTVLLYLFLELIMRLMGKRELAQLETGELILDGTVRALYYTDETKTAEGGFFARLLR